MVLFTCFYVRRFFFDLERNATVRRETLRRKVFQHLIQRRIERSVVIAGRMPMQIVIVYRIRMMFDIHRIGMFTIRVVHR
jgi:hypothetical protein